MHQILFSAIPRSEKPLQFKTASANGCARWCKPATPKLAWRNWQTRTAQDRMGQPVEVRVLSRALYLCGARSTAAAHGRHCAVRGSASDATSYSPLNV